MKSKLMLAGAFAAVMLVAGLARAEDVVTDLQRRRPP